VDSSKPTVVQDEVSPQAARPVRQLLAIVTTELRLPEPGRVVGTRDMLAAGVALLVADRFSAETRRGIGWALVGVGVLTTIPLAMLVFGNRRRLA